MQHGLDSGTDSPNLLQILPNMRDQEAQEEDEHCCSAKAKAPMVDANEQAVRHLEDAVLCDRDWDPGDRHGSRFIWSQPTQLIFSGSHHPRLAL